MTLGNEELDAVAISLDPTLYSDSDVAYARSIAMQGVGRRLEAGQTLESIEVSGLMMAANSLFDVVSARDKQVKLPS